MGDIRPKTTSPKIGSNRCARFALVVEVVFIEDKNKDKDKDDLDNQCKSSASI